MTEFRKCLFSFHVIDYFNVYSKHCPGRSGKVALKLIRDLPNPEALFLHTLSEAIEIYTISSKATSTEQQKLDDETNTNYLMATILYRLFTTLQTPPSYTNAELSQCQAAAAEGFKAVNDQRLPTGFDVVNIIFSTLGPQSALGKDALKTYNRTYNLLRSISHALSPSRWKNKYMKENVDPFHPLSIHVTAIPRWMMQAKTTNNLGSSMRAPPLPSKKIKLLWDRARKIAHTEALGAHIEKFIDFHELLLPKTEEACVKDSRVFPTGEMWRDTVRRQLRLGELKARPCELCS